MPIAITCGSCGTKLKAPDNAAGHKLKCPKCSKPILVAGGSPAAPAAASTTADKAVAVGTKANKAAPAVKAAAKVAPVGKAVEKAAPAPSRPPKAKAPSAASAWEQSDLLKHDEWTIKLKSFVILNFWNRHYNILKPNTKDAIGVADETASFLILMLRGMRFDKWLPTTVEVRDRTDGPMLLTVRKAVTPFAFSNTFEIYDHQSEKIGYFKTKIFSLLGGFWVYDAEDKEIAEVKAKLGLPPRYVFHAKDGRELGSVTSEKYAQVAETLKTKKVATVVTFGRPGMRLKIDEAMTDQPTIKVLMLATALAIEFSGLGDRLLDQKS